MAESFIKLPFDAHQDFEVYVNGVQQREHVDYTIVGSTLRFGRPLRKDNVAGWRWLLGAWGVGTYRQDDTVDIRYERHGQMHVAHALPIELVDEDALADQPPHHHPRGER